jgi:GST-like protein
MLDLYFWTTPNGYKPLIFLKEARLDYRLLPVNIGTGEQFDPDFLKIAPNNRIPALVDHAPQDGGDPVSIFESGAILLYLAEKVGRFLPDDARGRSEVLQWLFWQMGGLGPMAGQNHHFSHYAPQKIPYAINRYQDETARLYRVLNAQLAGRDFIAGDYSIADMASYPWIVPHEKQGIDLADYRNVERWFHAIAQRPAIQAAYKVGGDLNTAPTVTEESRVLLFGQR